MYPLKMQSYFTKKQGINPYFFGLFFGEMVAASVNLAGTFQNVLYKLIVALCVLQR